MPERAPCRVLIADDSRAVREGLRYLLAEDATFKVVGEAVDGESAIVEADKLRPDLVILDVEMPRRDGISACRAIKAGPGAPRVVFLTAYDDAVTRERAAEAGGDGLVAKTAHFPDLIGVLRRSLASPRGAAL
jgi:DNA-binding NarL/FixJ family response regulator